MRTPAYLLPVALLLLCCGCLLATAAVAPNCTMTIGPTNLTVVNAKLALLHKGETLCLKAGTYTNGQPWQPGVYFSGANISPAPGLSTGDVVIDGGYQNGLNCQFVVLSQVSAHFDSFVMMNVQFSIQGNVSVANSIFTNFSQIAVTDDYGHNVNAAFYATNTIFEHSTSEDGSLACGLGTTCSTVGCTFRNSSAGVNAYIGAVSVSGAYTSNRDLFANINAPYGGGGILNHDGLVTVVGSTFLSNTGGYYGGGAILSIGGALFVRGATFQNNIAGLGTICLSSQYLSMPRGGAIYATQSTFLRVQNSVFESNTGCADGAIYFASQGGASSPAHPPFTIAGCEIRNNIALYGGAGGVNVNYPGSITDSVVTQNTVQVLSTELFNAGGIVASQAKGDGGLSLHHTSVCNNEPTQMDCANPDTSQCKLTDVSCKESVFGCVPDCHSFTGCDCPNDNNNSPTDQHHTHNPKGHGWVIAVVVCAVVVVGLAAAFALNRTYGKRSGGGAVGGSGGRAGYGTINDDAGDAGESGSRGGSGGGGEGGYQSLLG